MSHSLIEQGKCENYTANSIFIKIKKGEHISNIVQPAPILTKHSYECFVSMGGELFLAESLLSQYLTLLQSNLSNQFFELLNMVVQS